MIVRKVLLLVFSTFVLGGAGSAYAGNGRFTPIGPDGGEALAIRIDPSAPRIVYAAAGLGGLFKSTDGGGSWQRLPIRPSSLLESVRDVALDPSQPSTLYAAFGHTVLRSRNGGASFSEVGAAIAATQVHGLAVDPRNPAVVYATTDRGLWKSADAGRSWFLASPDLEGMDVSSVALDPRSPQTLFAAAMNDEGRGVYRSTNGGATWTLKSAGLSPLLSPEAQYSLALVVDPDVAGRIFATYHLFRAPWFTPINYRSTDGGETWARLGGVADHPLIAGRGLLLAGRRRSTDGGATWAASGVPGAPLASLAFDPAAPRVVYAGSEVQGIARSTDGGRTWKNASRGFGGASITGLGVDAKGAGTLLAGVIGERLWVRPLAPAGGFQLQNPGLSDHRLGAFIEFDPDPRTSRTLYADYSDTPTKSTDGGRSFAFLSVGDARCFVFNDLEVDPVSPDTLYVVGQTRIVETFHPENYCPSGCNLWKSRDGGASFSCLENTGLHAASRVAFHPARPATVYLAAFSQLARSTDRGETWERFAAPGIKGLAFDPRRAEILYAGTARGVQRSTDGGRTWSAVSRGFDLPVDGLIVDPRAPDILYAGVDQMFVQPSRSGVYRSRDGGRTWSRIPGLPEGLSRGLFAFDPARSTVYAGTFGQGVFAATLPR